MRSSRIAGDGTWWEAYMVDAFESGLHYWSAPLGEMPVDVLVPLGSWDEDMVRCISSSSKVPYSLRHHADNL